jgi:hypothetical protein
VSTIMRPKSTRDIDILSWDVEMNDSISIILMGNGISDQ